LRNWGKECFSEWEQAANYSNVLQDKDRYLIKNPGLNGTMLKVNLLF
jgi:hypothetical protein